MKVDDYGGTNPKLDIRVSGPYAEGEKSSETAHLAEGRVWDVVG